MWLAASIPGVIRGRHAVVHNNLFGDFSNMGGIYEDKDVVIDGDLTSARTGNHCHLFARAIIDQLAERTVQQPN